MSSASRPVTRVGTGGEGEKREDKAAQHRSETMAEEGGSNIPNAGECHCRLSCETILFLDNKPWLEVQVWSGYR